MNANCFPCRLPTLMGVSQAYRAVEMISFAGTHYRRDIAARALAHRGG